MLQASNNLNSVFFVVVERFLTFDMQYTLNGARKSVLFMLGFQLKRNFTGLSRLEKHHLLGVYCVQEFVVYVLIIIM